MPRRLRPSVGCDLACAFVWRDGVWLLRQCDLPFWQRSSAGTLRSAGAALWIFRCASWVSGDTKRADATAHKFETSVADEAPKKYGSRCEKDKRVRLECKIL